MKRLTPAESDALVAHLSPAERRRRVALLLEALRFRGVDAREVFDATGRSYIKMDIDQVREKLGDEIADELLGMLSVQPEPKGHRPSVA